MARRNYKTFTQRELDGGMNLDSSPNEIDNKQCLSAINFNADGNKLVSAKGMSDSGNPTTANIGAITIDSGDIWTVSNGDILKNGVVLDSGVGILVTTNSDTFKPGVAFYLTINGVDYTITGLSVQDFIYNLKAAVEANGLITVAQDNIILIRKADGSALTYSVTSNTAYLLYDFAQAQFNYGQDYYWEVILNGITYSGTYTMSSPALNQGQADLEMLDDIFTAIPGSVDKQKVFLNSSFEITEYYTSYAGILFNGITSISSSTKKSYNVIRINGYSESATPNYSSNRYYGRIFTLDGVAVMGPINYRFGGYGTTTINWTSVVLQFDGRTINIPDITANGNAFMAHVVGQVAVQPYASTYCWTNWGVSSTSYGGLGRRDGLAMTGTLTLTGLSNGTPFSSNITSWTNDVNSQALNDMPFIGWKDFILNDINGRSGYYANEDSSSGTLGIHINKDDLTYLEGVDGLFKVTQPLYRQTQDIRGVPFQETNAVVRPLSDGGGLLGRAHITVGNLGNLVVDRDSGGAFYSYEGMKVKISDTSVGEPKLGTIYQGKIVLGGYEGNDNIVFSQTSSLTTPLNVLEFGAYNAGGQSVSGGNKSKITGFSVGENGLYVFKENEVWYTNSETDSPDNSRFNYIFNKITNTGAYSQTVITQVEQDIFYLDWINRKVRRLSYEQNLTTLRDTAISNEIDSLFSSLPANQALATSSFKYPNYKLYLSDHTGGSITYPNGRTYYLNNKCFVYNVSNKSWFLENDKTGVIVTEDGYIAKSDGKIYLDDTGLKTSGSYLSKHYDMGESVGYKRFTEFDIYGENSNNVPLYLDIYKEGVLSETFLIEGTTFRKKFGLWTQSRFFQFGLRYEGASNIVIHDFSIEFKELYGFDIYKG